MGNRSTVISYGTSGLLHASLLAALILWSIPARWVPEVPVDTTIGQSADTPPSDEFPVGAETPKIEPIRSEPASVGADALAAADPTDSGLADFARRRLQQTRDEAANRSPQEQVDELKTLAARLSSVSSTQSLEQLTDSIAPWIGSTSERATEPDATADPAVPFDVTTAQITDVVKQDVDGRREYVAVMVDATGRRQQTPLDPADGETLYDVFQLMQQFPLLRTVYQKTVMGLLDRLLEEERTAAEGSASAPPADRDDSQ